MLARTSTGAAAAALQIAHADGALAVEHDRGRVCIGAHREIAPPHRGVEEAAGGADATAIVHDALHVTHACLRRAVVVAITRDPHFDGAFDEGLAQGVAPFEIGDG